MGKVLLISALYVGIVRGHLLPAVVKYPSSPGFASTSVESDIYDGFADACADSRLPGK